MKRQSTTEKNGWKLLHASTRLRPAVLEKIAVEAAKKRVSVYSYLRTLIEESVCKI